MTQPLTHRPIQRLPEEEVDKIINTRKATVRHEQ